MNTVSRDKIKKKSLHRLFNSFKYAFQGIKEAFKEEENLTVHTIITIIVVVLGIILKLNKFEWISCILVIGLVIGSELINTALEAVVDLTCKKIDPVAKIAKDTAAAAVLVFALTAAIVGLIIFVPKIVEAL